MRGPGGRIRLPIRFPSHNPFQKSTQLRNWLLYLFFRELGLRRGEALKVTLQDLPSADSDLIVIRRRPGDPADTRKPKPEVKGIEGAVPVSPVIRLGLRVYLSDLRNPGRRRKGSPYLFTTRLGTPLSLSDCNRLFRTIVNRHPGVLSGLSPQVLRHTWAEEIANDLIVRGQEEQNALAILREAGRWKPTSNVPLHYIQNALRTAANNYLRERHHALYRQNVLDTR